MSSGQSNAFASGIPNFCDYFVNDAAVLEAQARDAYPVGSDGNVLVDAIKQHGRYKSQIFGIPNFKDKLTPDRPVLTYVVDYHCQDKAGAPFEWSLWFLLEQDGKVRALDVLISLSADALDNSGLALRFSNFLDARELRNAVSRRLPLGTKQSVFENAMKEAGGVVGPLRFDEGRLTYSQRYARPWPEESVYPRLGFENTSRVIAEFNNELLLNRH